MSTMSRYYFGSYSDVSVLVVRLLRRPALVLYALAMAATITTTWPLLLLLGKASSPCPNCGPAVTAAACFPNVCALNSSPVV